MENKTNIRIDRIEKSIYLSDLEDQWNMPRGYNKLIRGFNKVADYIEENKSELEKLSMYQVIGKLDTIADLKFRTYCAMD